MGNGLAALARALSGFGLTWLVQSSVLLALGLLAGPRIAAVGPGGPVGRLPDDAGGRSRLPVRVGGLERRGIRRAVVAAAVARQPSRARARSAGRSSHDDRASRRNRTCPSPTLRESSEDRPEVDARRSGRSDAERTDTRAGRGEPAARPWARRRLRRSAWLSGCSGRRSWGYGCGLGQAPNAHAAGVGCSGRGGGRGALPRRRAADERRVSDASGAARSCSARAWTGSGGRRSCCRMTSARICAKRSCMSWRTSLAATACGTCCGAGRPPGSGCNRWSGCSRGGSKRPPRKFATTTWSTWAASEPIMPGISSSSPGGPCRRSPPRAWA